MERVVEGGNLRCALKRVQEDEGSPGVDGLTVDELPAYLREHWPMTREQLLMGRYQPSVVKRVAIPKPGRWRALVRHSDRARSVHSAGRVTGPATHDRSHLLGVQLWLSAGPAWISGSTADCGCSC